MVSDIKLNDEILEIQTPCDTIQIYHKTPNTHTHVYVYKVFVEVVRFVYLVNLTVNACAKSVFGCCLW